MKKLILFFTAALALSAQATFTQGAAPTTAKPSVLTIANGGPTCTVSGDTFPATKITVGTCTFGGVTIPGFTITNTVTLPWAISYQINSGVNAFTFILNITSVSPFTVQATVNASPAVGGAF